MNREKIVSALAELPILQYEFFSPEALCFSERVRQICRAECPMYGKTWACPPGVGSVDACREKCLSYPEALLLTTVAEVQDVTNMEETLATRREHEDITAQVRALLDAEGQETFVLSSEACARCEKCSYPSAPCRHPGEMFPCIESHGILVTALAEKFGIEFIAGNTVIWFSILFFRPEKEDMLP